LLVLVFVRTVVLPTVVSTVVLLTLAQVLVHKYKYWSVDNCSVEALFRRVGFRPVFRRVGFRPVFRRVGFRPGIVGYGPVAS
jgi:hypothetical protein